MKRVRLLNVCLISLVSPLLALACVSSASAQIPGLTSEPLPPRGKPFVGIREPLPKSVTAKPMKKSRAGGTTAATVDLTPQTAAVNDAAPYWTKDEQYVFFQSNRTDLAGTAAGSTYHIYRMSPVGTNVTAVTGPLATPATGAALSQLEPAVNSSATSAVYVEIDAAGTPDIIEMSLGSKSTKSLVRNNPSGLRFVAISGPEYATWPGMSTPVIFAGKTGANQPYKLYMVDGQTGVVATVTTGISDDRNPAVSPAVDGSQANNVIAFDSNRADAMGTTVKATRDIWVMTPVSTTIPPRRVTNFTAGSTPTDNIEPSWSTNKPDDSLNTIVGGQQLLGFSTTRADSRGDGLADSVSANGSRDIYWLQTDIGQNPDHPGLTVLTPETAGNPAFKLPTGDPGHIYDDRHPTWPQFASTYRVVYQTNRTAYDPVLNASQPLTPGPATTTDLFGSTLIDVNAPTLVRYDETIGEIVRVEPRLASPGQPVKISVKLNDLETGINAVYVQIKNPNSKYQASDGKEHKVYLTTTANLDASNIALEVPVEYESERIFIGSDPGAPQRNTYAEPRYRAGMDDRFAFSGGASPADLGWLRLNFESRDTTTGVSTYTANWTTDIWPSDYYVDVVAYDNAKDPFSGDTRNWKIYDNVWGFTTQPFQPAAHGVLFVSDYAAGQKFFSSRFGSSSLVNVFHTFWGTESWMTDIDTNLLPVAYINGTTRGNLHLVLNALGVKSYGAFDPRDSWTQLGYDGMVIDGSKQDGADVPITQQYDLWRILCRGPLPDAVLKQYLPYKATEPPDLVNLETDPRPITVAHRAVIWHAPFTGNVFAGPGSLVDLDVQNQLAAFQQAGGRMLVNGQDVGWALTLDGQVPSAFLANVLKARYVRDTIAVSGNGALGLTGAGAYNPISTDPWFNPPNKFLGSSWHSYPGPPFPPGDQDFISRDGNFLCPGPDPAVPRTYGSYRSNRYPDVVDVLAGAIPDLTYAGGGVATLHHLDAATGARLVYSPMGLEALFTDFFNPPNTTNLICLKNRRTELLHNALCWFRTGVVTGSVLDVEGGLPLGNALVRLANRVGPNGRPITAHTAMTDSQGQFSIFGVEPDDYDIRAIKPGYSIQKYTFVTVHGLTKDTISFRMTKAEPAAVKGKVTRTDGTTPVVGAVVTLTDVLPPFATFTGATDIDGDYLIQRVPAQTVYKLTCSATGYGTSVPVSYPVPNPDDPIAGQRTEFVVPAQIYEGFDFQLKPDQGVATGRVLKAADDTAIVGGTVTAKLGTATVTAVTDSNGAYRFDKAASTPNGLDAGSWSLVASAPGYQASAAVSVTVVSQQTVSVADIKLASVLPGSISGLVTRTSDGVGQTGVAVEVRDGQGNLMGSATTGAASTDGTGYRSNYKISDVPAGVTYTVTATLQGFTPVPLSRQAAVTSATETKSVNFQMDPLHTFSGALSLMSTPYDYVAQDAGDLLSIPIGDRTDGSFLLASWELQKYAYYPSPIVSQFRLGRGYFLGYRTNIPLSTEGVSADTSRPFDIPLNTGWNLIGNPFPYDIDWTKVSVVDGGVEKDFGTAVSTGAIGSALYTYVSGTYVLDYKIASWRGYWARAYRSVTLRIDPTSDRYGRAAEASNGRAVMRGSEGWSVRLTASAGDLRDEDSYIGAASGATDGFDPFKVEKPPVVGARYIRLGSEHTDWNDKAGTYGVDIRSSGSTSATWNIVVASSGAAGPVTVAWPSMALVKRNVTLTLVDPATGTTRDMRSNSSYTWQSAGGDEARRLRVTASFGTRAALRISDVTARTSGRGTGIEVDFSLSASATVTARVLSAAGSQVRRIAGQTSRAAGSQQIFWDQKNDKGVAMPTGQYMVELRAQAPDGSQSVRSVVPVVVTR